MMTRIIGMKEFRNSLADVTKAVAKGVTFMVMSRSKPAFVVSPPKSETTSDLYANIEEVDEAIHMPGWTHIMDFTEGGKADSIEAGELLRIMKEFEKKHGQDF